jgi:hypothetical protein
MPLMEDIYSVVTFFSDEIYPLYFVQELPFILSRNLEYENIKQQMKDYLIG